MISYQFVSEFCTKQIGLKYFTNYTMAKNSYSVVKYLVSISNKIPKALAISKSLPKDPWERTEPIANALASVDSWKFANQIY